MDPILTIVLGFLLGEIILVLLVSWTYEQLISQANFPHNPATKRFVVFLFMLLPLVVALFTLPGLIERTNQARTFAMRATATASVSTLPGATSISQTAFPTQGSSLPTQALESPLPTPVPLETSPATEPVAPISPTDVPTQVEDSTPTLSPTSGEELSTEAPGTPTAAQLTKQVASLDFEKSTPTPFDPQVAPPTKQVASQEFEKSTPTPVGPQAAPLVKRVASQEFDKPTPTPPASEVLPETSLVKKRVEAKDLNKATQTPPAVPETNESPQASPEPETPPPDTDPTPAIGDTPTGKIVYTCQIFQDTARDQICLINADGTGFRRLTSNDNADHNFPALSPDGRSLVYTGNESGSFEIYEMNLETGEISKLTESEGNLLAPAISPDGRMIAFTNKTSGRQSIWIMNRDRSNPRQVFAPGFGDGWDPVWSPDGSRILFASNMSGGVKLFTIGIDGSNQQQVVQIEELPGRSDWSSDGTTIATYAGTSWQREIYLVSPDGSDLRQITEGGNNLAPSFSPDGSWIAFTSYRDNFGNPNGCEIYIMRNDGSQVTRLTRNDICDWQPRWGP